MTTGTVRWLHGSPAPVPTGEAAPAAGDIPHTVFVLGGGGNLGAVQVGMLRAVFERGIAPDVLVGCSVGAINGAVLAGDPTIEGVTHLVEMWRDIDGSTLCPSTGLASLWGLARRGLSIHEDTGLRKMVEDTIAFERFEDAKLPLHVIATSLRSGRERWFSTGEAMDAVLASAALPGAFPPVRIEGELYVDGAVVDNVPISKAIALGATRMVIFHVGNFHRPRPMPRRPIDVLLQSFSISRNYRYFHDIENVPAHIEVLELPSIDPGSIKYHDFRRSHELIERGYHASAAYLDRLPATAFGA